MRQGMAPKIPDLTVCNSSLWDILKSEISHIFHLQTVEDLPTAITECFVNCNHQNRRKCPKERGKKIVFYTYSGVNNSEMI